MARTAMPAVTSTSPRRITAALLLASGATLLSACVFAPPLHSQPDANAIAKLSGHTPRELPFQKA